MIRESFKLKESMSVNGKEMRREAARLEGEELLLNSLPIPSGGSPLSREVRIIDEGDQTSAEMGKSIRAYPGS